MSESAIDFKNGINDKAEIIADRINNIFVYIFIEAMNEIISINNFVVRSSFISLINIYHIEIKDLIKNKHGIEDFEYWANQHKIMILSKKEETILGVKKYIIKCEVPKNINLKEQVQDAIWIITKAQHIPLNARK
jgi:hypothetical protein